ncbi:MAG: hypothetical protein LM558_00090 [Thermosphaera sp.]|nr:hypothetical protein [Thermosphaera sp.]
MNNLNNRVAKGRRIQITVYMPVEIYEAMRKYLEDLQKRSPELEANMSRYVVSLVKEDLKNKGYLRE